MESAVLQIHHLYKRIGRHDILKDISLTIQRGEILGLIGPNGSGKTTLIRTIAGLIKANSGKVEICGKNIQSHFKEAIKEIGAIIENPEFYPYLTGYQNLRLWANMYKGIGQARIEEVVSLVQLQGSIHEKVSTYSLGMRQRLGVAQAILHKPKLLLLDEPTNGLDPSGMIELRTYLKRLSEKEGVAVLISSHLLHEIETICQRTTIIKDGTIIGNQSIEHFSDAKQQDVFYEVDDLDRAIQVLNAEDGTLEVERVDATKIRVRLRRDEMPLILKRLVDSEISVFEVKVDRSSLEDAFLAVTMARPDKTRSQMASGQRYRSKK
ncbi:ABC transporter ATP-binding protein [Pullulanibacillus sp. KACC 23026]|uniref:ABC transporter ATP-binding protein n=1 Tax=Pullulanibacillus sp. KACC 23026 TaxID=3028315 RepID=UPI0023AFC89F|nr:ABC transporter ATP-binding protein [Pullulanibacillus sp. KACC 23026]WEG11275.1 ABC transporter ATP-binding protein [Pullulanibacillus sp. KACC 23026]